MQSYHNLRVSARAREVIRATYRFTAVFPRSEQFGLTAQMRRAAVSSGLNIVEGCSRDSTRELIRFLQVSAGSAMELEFTLVIAADLGYGSEVDNRQLMDLNTVLQKELSALVGSLRSRLRKGSRE
ncbi:MAG TPA: four helix bundle protein [Gemmatimonadaceae bacterium]|nr:four helix bundle protein [Gemmatimonadaceae bacterium]